MANGGGADCKRDKKGTDTENPHLKSHEFGATMVLERW